MRYVLPNRFASRRRVGGARWRSRIERSNQQIYNGSCCYCFDIKSGLRCLALLSSGLSIWFVLGHIFMIVDAKEIDTKLLIFYCVGVAIACILLIPTVFLCKWLAYDNQ